MAEPLPSRETSVSRPADGTQGVFVERRKRPRLVIEPRKPQPLPTLADYEAIIDRATLDEIRWLSRRMAGKRIKLINATALGGSVADALNRTVPLLQELQIQAQWDVITGGNDFYHVNKAFLGALQGAEYQLTRQVVDVYLSSLEQNRNRMDFSSDDIIVVHDIQPVPLVESRSTQKWIWRCNIDLSKANADVWGFFRPYVERYDAALFSSAAFTRPMGIPEYLFYPSIDPLSEKNKQLDEEFVTKVCEDFGIDRKRPIVTQISRFERRKDPVGVVQAYKLAKRYVDFQLVLAGGGANEDPDAALVLDKVLEEAGDDPDIIVLNLPPWCALEVNALQQASDVIVQKSVQEGFGLTITEALWKGKPVIGSAVGGIPTQIVHKITGVLVHSIEGCAYQIRYLLTHPDFARQIGQQGREHVKENFLITTSLKKWLVLCRRLLGEC